MAPPGMYYMGSTYWAGSFGLGGNQTTWDSSTGTYSQNKDWLAGELYAAGTLAADWLIFFQNHLECIGGVCTKVSGTGTNTCSTPGQICNTSSTGSSSTLLLIGAAIAAGIVYLIRRKI